jgi:hypothetical protein
LWRVGDALAVPEPSNFVIQSPLDCYGGCRSLLADVEVRN